MKRSYERVCANVLLGVAIVIASCLVVTAELMDQQSQEGKLCNCKKYLWMLDWQDNSLVQLDLTTSAWGSYSLKNHSYSLVYDMAFVLSSKSEPLFYLSTSTWSNNKRVFQVVEVEFSPGSQQGPQLRRVLLNDTRCLSITYEEKRGNIFCYDYYKNNIIKVSQNGTIYNEKFTIEYSRWSRTFMMAAEDKLYAANGSAIHVFDVSFTGDQNVIQEKTNQDARITHLFVDDKNLYWVEDGRSLFARPLLDTCVKGLLPGPDLPLNEKISSFVVDTDGDTFYYSTWLSVTDSNYNSKDLFQCSNFSVRTSCGRIHSDIYTHRLLMVSRCESDGVTAANDNPYHEGFQCGLANAVDQHNSQVTSTFLPDSTNSSKISPELTDKNSIWWSNTLTILIILSVGLCLAALTAALLLGLRWQQLKTQRLKECTNQYFGDIFEPSNYIA